MKMKRKNTSKEYEVGSIAQLIAAAAKKNKPIAGTENDSDAISGKGLYDPKLSKIFKKNSVKVESPGPETVQEGLPIIPSFTKYAPIVQSQIRTQTTSNNDWKSKPKPKDVKLSFSEAAAIRVAAKLKSKEFQAKRSGGQEENSEDLNLSPQALKRQQRNKAAKLRIKKIKQRRAGKTVNDKKQESGSTEAATTKSLKRAIPEDKVEDEESKTEKVKKIKFEKSDPKDRIAVVETKNLTNEKLTTTDLNRPKEKDSERESRTVFVGNVPKDSTTKMLKTFFSSCGTIETVRLRCATPAKPTALKKIALRKNELHPNRTSLVAYIRFTTREDAEKAVTEKNGVEFKEHHLNVDLADKSLRSKAKDNKRAVFVGNLHLQTEDDELWEAFKDCGEIQSVRIIRDQASCLGKGFGYVNFQTAEAVKVAIEKNDILQIRNRPLRISKCVKKLKVKKTPGGSGSHQFDSNHTPGNQNNQNQSTQAQPRHNTNKTFTNQDTNNFGGDRLSEIGKLKRKAKRVNLGDRKKAAIARQLAGESKPKGKRGKKSNGKSQGQRKRGETYKSEKSVPLKKNPVAVAKTKRYYS